MAKEMFVNFHLEKCVFFLIHAIKHVTFHLTTVSSQIGCWFSPGKNHNSKTTLEIVKDFVEQICNNNGIPWKSSGILRVTPKTLDIF